MRRKKTISKHQKKTKSKDEMLLFVGRKRKKNKIKTSNYLRWSEVCFETKENGFPVFPQTVREPRANSLSQSYFLSSSFLFLAVQDHSIGDRVTD